MVNLQNVVKAKFMFLYTVKQKVAERSSEATMNSMIIKKSIQGLALSAASFAQLLSLRYVLEKCDIYVFYSHLTSKDTKKCIKA